jgi:hypothetical protein
MGRVKNTGEKLPFKGYIKVLNVGGRSNVPSLGHIIVFRMKSGIMRKEIPFLAPVCFPHRREI